MRWARYLADGKTHYGIVNADLTIDEVEGSPFESTRPTGVRRKVADVKLLPPVIPGTFYAVGFNYLGHTAEAGEFLAKDVKIPKKPDVGYRANNALVGDGDEVMVPRSSPGVIQFEGELVAVVGKKAKFLTEENALDCLLGYTIGNDISERYWQKMDRTIWRAKNSDTFKPMGPWIETDVSLPELVTTIRLNGQQVSQFKTNGMLFGVARYLAEISSAITLNPGDVLWMGAETPSLDMRAGDVCEVEISGIGVLRNPIVAER